MNQKKKASQLWIRILCWILAGLMVMSVGTYLIYALLGLM